MTTLEQIKEHPTYKQVLADSFGGIVYNVANQGKYDAEPVLKLWDSMTKGEQHAAGGIVKGAIGFLKGE